jgi:hypothetical protein
MKHFAPNFKNAQDVVMPITPIVIALLATTHPFKELFEHYTLTIQQKYLFLLL